MPAGRQALQGLRRLRRRRGHFRPAHLPACAHCQAPPGLPGHPEASSGHRDHLVVGGGAHRAHLPLPHYLLHPGHEHHGRLPAAGLARPHRARVRHLRAHPGRLHGAHALPGPGPPSRDPRLRHQPHPQPLAGVPLVRDGAHGSSARVCGRERVHVGRRGGLRGAQHASHRGRLRAGPLRRPSARLPLHLRGAHGQQLEQPGVQHHLPPREGHFPLLHGVDRAGQLDAAQPLRGDPHPGLRGAEAEGQRLGQDAAGAQDHGAAGGGERGGARDAALGAFQQGGQGRVRAHRQGGDGLPLERA
mmetsp:Transcript_6303/g.20155  ORF Transcript_6303/g.20155 Transcript_6303/m.20155 type:complete len:302 (-) Transcript_6303:712-1617(-)